MRDLIVAAILALLVLAMYGRDQSDRWSRNAECTANGGTVVPAKWPLIFHDDCSLALAPVTQ